MNGWGNRGAAAAVAAALAGAFVAPAASGQGWLEAEVALQRGREALFQKRYAAAAWLCTTAYLEDPSNAEARRCLRKAALAGASGEILAVQEESRQIMSEAEKSRHIDALIKRRRYLEAYDLVYAALEADRSDERARERLEKLQRAVGGSLPGDLGLKDERYRNAVLGFYEMSQGKWPGMRRAREHWLEALMLTGAKIPESRIRRYLARIDRQEKRLEAAPGTARPAGSPPAGDIGKELDELLQ